MASAGFTANRLSTLVLLGTVVLMATFRANASDMLNEYLRAADSGDCIENVTFTMIRERGPAHAEPIVTAALAALAQRVSQQRSLGCQGDIAAQAIAAGADPEKVLAATAAGL